MKAIVFSKHFKDRTPAELVELAHELGVAGYDLAVRPEHPVNPDNAQDELPRLAALMRKNGLSIPMVTGNFDLLEPSHPTALPVLRGMAEAGVGLLKLGYFRYRPDEHVYTEEVERVRGILAQWQEPAREYGVKVCYHCHSGWYMGMNVASLMHLLSGFDPECLGAYLDPCHMAINGEAFPTGLAMARDYLSILSAKDVLLTRSAKNGHGSTEMRLVQAGEGMVDWTEVFDGLAGVGYDGPVSIHCEFEAPEGQFMGMVRREIAFFRRFIEA